MVLVNALAQESSVVGWHAHKDRGSGHGLEYPGGIKSALKDHRATRKDRQMESDKQAMDMKNRQGVQHDVGWGPVPSGFERLCIADQVFMTDHGAFWQSGGA